MRSLLRTVGLLLLMGVETSAAQRTPRWSVSAGIGTTQFSGAARSGGAADGLAFAPYRPTHYQLRVTRTIGRIQVGLRTSYSEPGIAVRGSAPEMDDDTNLLVVAERALTVQSIGPEIGVRVAQLPGLSAVWVHGAVDVERWAVRHGAGRMVASPRLGAILHVPITGWIEGLVEGSTAYSSSPFRAEDLPDGVGRRDAWRYGLTLGAGVRW